MPFSNHRNYCVQTIKVLLPALLASVFLLPITAAAQKTDVITFKNGDQLTVDIKEFERGVLRASTVGLGTIHIEWDVIHSISTNKTYRIELNSGAKMLGAIRPAEESEILTIRMSSGQQEIEFSDVVSMIRVKREKSFWDRIDGSVQLGMNYASGSEIGQANVGLNASFLEQNYEVHTDFGATVTTGSSKIDTRRFDWTTSYARTMQNRWFWVVTSGLNSNDELGIELRALGGGGFGRVLMKDNSKKWTLVAGLAASRESRAGEFGQSQIEGMLMSNYSLFYFSPTKSDLSLDLALFPGITESGRLRGNFDIKMRWEIIQDFTWNLTYYLTWDNRPPDGAATEDMGITTSLGYTF
jgi:putative salt-induced outer membrane protein YdiY